jgi:hypothetical protein
MRPSVRAAVLGGAASTFDELETLRAWGGWDLLVATNRAGAEARDRVDHWVTYHPEQLGGWLERRRALGLPVTATIWTSARHRSYRERGFGFVDNPWGGSSGLLAVQVALAQGATRVALCGVPLSVEGSHYHDQTPWRRGPWKEAPSYRRAWETHVDALVGPVRSFDGWTRDLLGVVTENWWYGTTDRDTIAVAIR